MDKLPKKVYDWLKAKPPKSQAWIARKLNIPVSTLRSRLEREQREAKGGGVDSRSIDLL